jgi:hypothetical protein
MGLPKIVAIAGLAAIVLGVVLALAPAAQEVWKARSELLKSGGDAVSPRLNHTILLVSLTVPEGARNLVVRGHVEEAGGRPFDLEVTNGRVYVRAANVSSYNFTLSPSPAELRAGLHLVIANTRAAAPVTESLVSEVMTVAGFSNVSYTFVRPLVMPPRKVPVEVRGIAVERAGRKFNLYIVDEGNLALLRAGMPLRAYYAGRGSSRYEYSFVIPAERCDEPVYFVVERVPELARREENFTLTLRVFPYAERDFWFYPLLLFKSVGGVTLAGRAVETGGRAFDLFILSKEDFDRYWAGAQPLSPYFAGTGKPLYEFSFTVPAGRAREPVYFVVRRLPSTPPNVTLNVLVEGRKEWSEEYRPELAVLINATKSYPKPVDITVRYTIEASWEERSYAAVLGGMLAGGVLAGLGLLLLIAAAVLKYASRK